MTNYILVFMTTSSIDEAEKISRLLIEKKLIACATFLDKAISIYPWKGKIEKEGEVEVRMKAQAADFEKIVEIIESIHSYDVPQILSINISNVNNKYRLWLEETFEV